MRKELYIATLFSLLGFGLSKFNYYNPYKDIITVYVPEDIIYINPYTFEVTNEGGSIDTIFKTQAQMHDFVEDLSLYYSEQVDYRFIEFLENCKATITSEGIELCSTNPYLYEDIHVVLNRTEDNKTFYNEY